MRIYVQSRAFAGCLPGFCPARRHAVSWHAATLKSFLRSGVSKFQTFEIIKDCCARGYEWLDFNPSAGLGGVQELKESFRAEALPAPLVYVDTPLKSVIRKCAAAFNVKDAKIFIEPLDSTLPPAPHEKPEETLAAQA